MYIKHENFKILVLVSNLLQTFDEDLNLTELCKEYLMENIYKLTVD